LFASRRQLSEEGSGVLFVENSQVGGAYNIDDLVDKKPPFLVDEASAKVARVFKANGYNGARNDGLIALV